MESFVSVSTLFNLVLTVIWFISGIRDLQGKDPFLDLPFNQYHRDPEYRAFWQKKNGVFYMLNSIAFLILAFTPVTSLIYRIIFGIASWETFFILSLTKAGTIVRIDSRKGATMNLNLSDWDWLNAALGVLFYTAASGICTMAPAPDGAVRTKRSTSANFTALLRSFAVHSIWSTFFCQRSSR